MIRCIFSQEKINFKAPFNNIQHSVYNSNSFFCSVYNMWTRTRPFCYFQWKKNVFNCFHCSASPWSYSLASTESSAKFDMCIALIVVGMLKRIINMSKYDFIFSLENVACISMNHIFQLNRKKWLYFLLWQFCFTFVHFPAFCCELVFYFKKIILWLSKYF